MYNYQQKTTFWQDFTIADHFGINAIKDTHKRAFESWKNNTEYLTELVLVLNWKIWDWYEKNEKIAEVYNTLWEYTQNWAYDNLKGDELKYFLEVID